MAVDQDGYRHDGGSNRVCARDGRLIGWFVYAGPGRTNLRIVDRDGETLLIEHTDDGDVAVRTETGAPRALRPVTKDDPYYLELADDGSVRVLVDGSGHLCVPFEELERAKGKL